MRRHICMLTLAGSMLSNAEAFAATSRSRPGWQKMPRRAAAAAGGGLGDLTQAELDALPELTVDPKKQIFESKQEKYSDRFDYVTKALNGMYTAVDPATDTETEAAGMITAALMGESFPCTLELTIVGKDRAELIGAVEATLAKHDGGGGPGEYSVVGEKLRAGGKFTSITFGYAASSPDMAAEVADVLRATGSVLMCF